MIFQPAGEGIDVKPVSLADFSKNYKQILITLFSWDCPFKYYQNAVNFQRN
jgi:hypothetical protein